MIRKSPLRRKAKLKSGVKVEWGGLSPASKKRMKQNREYYEKRKKFLKAHPYCQWWLSENDMPLDYTYRADGSSADGWLLNCPHSTDIHHKAGRGKYLLDTSTWMAVSRLAHIWIHEHPKESYERGYMLPRR